MSRNPAAATLASRITEHLRALPERRDEPLDFEEAAFFANAVRGWAAEAVHFTIRDVCDVRELRKSLAGADSLLQSYAPRTGDVRRYLNEAAEAAGPPDLTIPDAVDRFFGP